MPEILAARIHSDRRFPPGEELLLALGLATADLGALSTGILDGYDLTHAQYNVLRMLRGAGDRGLSHAEIRRWMVVGVPDVTRLVDRLERRGLVRRDRDPGDRRRVLHRIEEAGLSLLDGIEPEMGELHDWIERSLPASHRRSLVELCEEVIRISARRSGRELSS